METMVLVFPPWATVVVLAWFLISLILIGIMGYEAEEAGELDGFTSLLIAVVGLGWPLLVVGLLIQAVLLRVEDRAEARGQDLGLEQAVGGQGPGT